MARTWTVDPPAAERLREIRARLGLTQRELARMLDVSGAAVCLYEEGRRRPTGARAEAYARLNQVLFAPDPRSADAVKQRRPP